MPGSRALRLSAEAHHVAASILLKLGDQGLAWVAADRSMQAARASQDPLTAGSSARIITHALMSSGHLGAAMSTASNLAARLDSLGRDRAQPGSRRRVPGLPVPRPCPGATIRRDLIGVAAQAA
jgi:hypothetical protein